MVKFYSLEAIAQQEAAMRRECAKLTSQQLRALHTALTDDITRRRQSPLMRLSRWVPWTTGAEWQVWERIAVRNVIAEHLSRVSAL